jgi:kynurenine 3-monooxygenase
MKDGSFVCTAFLPSKQFQILERDPSKVPAFFDEHFPGVTRLISPEDLVHYFQLNPHLPLVSIKCSPFHFSSSAVILGDAAHAMVPFYGQGMNAGLEDVRILFEMLDQHLGSSSKVKTGAEEGNTASTKLLASALAQYSRARVPDAHAINDMALQNYVEMRASVVSPAYRLRKLLEEALSVYLPGLGWQTRYARVSFGTDRYSRVLARSEWQGRVLSRITTGAAVLPLLYGAGVLWWRYRRVLEANLGGLSDWMAAVFGGGGA